MDDIAGLLWMITYTGSKIRGISTILHLSSLSSIEDSLKKGFCLKITSIRIRDTL